MPTASIEAPQTTSPTDPLMAQVDLPLSGLFFPLGFAVEIVTNSITILEAAAESWGRQHRLSSTPPLKIRLGQTSASDSGCPAGASIRASGHLLSIIADADNFAVCDLRAGTAFGWVTEAAVAHRSYLRYHFLEAIVMCLLSCAQVTPIHGAAVRLAGKGLLLCGDSGAGKSTLAYACARAGWTLTSDDASYLLWNGPTPSVRGNPHQLRFRPSARDLFPELASREITPRAEGKPSVEVCTAELPHIAIASQTPIHAILRLHRQPSSDVHLTSLQPIDLQPYFEASLFPLEGIREAQLAALAPLLRLPLYELRYRDLPSAIVRLEELTRRLQA